MSFPDQQRAEPFRLEDMTRPVGGAPPRPHQPSRWPFVVAGVAVLVLLVGSVTVYALWPKSTDSGTAAPAATSTGPTGPTAAAPATTGAQSPAVPAIHKFGEGALSKTGAVKVTAFGYKQPVAAKAPKPDQDGYEWAAADVEVCALVDDVIVNNLAWHLVYADHTTIAASHIGYQQFPEPSYPWGDKPLANGRCVRGWITYGVPSGKRPATVEHSPESGGVNEWAVS